MTIAQPRPVLRLGQLLLGSAALLAFLVTVVLSLGARDSIQQMGVAQNDHSIWNATQLEIEFLKLKSAINEEFFSDSPDADRVRRRFDIFYSRIPLIQSNTLNPVELEKVSDLKSFLDSLIPLIDGPPERLIAGLGNISEQLKQHELQTRDIVVGSVGRSLEVKTTSRLRTIMVLEYMLLLNIATTLFLILAIVVLMRRTAMLQKASVLAADRHQQLMATIRGSLAAIVVTDCQGRVIDFNGSAEQVFGYSRDFVIGKVAADFMTPERHRAELANNLKKFRETGQKTMLDKGKVDLTMLHADGTEFLAEMSVSLAQTRKGPIFVSYVRDITEERQREDELLQARDTALQAVKDRSRFFAMMSHEMRTPLNGVLSALHLLEDSELTDEQRADLQMALFSGDILMEHINDVLAIERSEVEEDVDMRPCDMASLTASVVGMMQPMAREFRVLLDLQQKGLAGRHFLIEQRTTQQILINLLSNAIKFSPDGAVSLYASYQCASDDSTRGRMRFEVSDTGIGISPQDQDRIFEDFVSLDNRYERRTGGTGLGLGIVRRLTERLDGRIFCDSQLAEGSTFTVDFPVCEASVTSDTPQRKNTIAATATSSKSVLVVDDNKINCDLLRKMLERLGHVVTTAGSGQTAIDLTAHTAFDLVLMDIAMPNISGTKACQFIRSRPGPNQNTPIIAFTAQALASEQQVFRAARDVRHPVETGQYRRIANLFAKRLRRAPHRERNRRRQRVFCGPGPVRRANCRFDRLVRSRQHRRCP